MQVPDTMARLRDVLPRIRKRREEIEAARQLPRDLAEELRRTGLFDLSVPRALGGREAEPIELLRAIEMVATADGSAGWLAMVGVANNATAGYMPEAGAREVYADPTVPSAGIAAPAGAATRVAGGVKVSGRWPFASGIAHCDWVFAGCLVMENGKPRMTEHGPEIVHACVPVRDVQIHDTWYVSGLRGTGSQDFSVAEVFVPQQRVFNLFDASGYRPEPLYQMPAVHLFVLQVVAVSLGIARSALDEVTELAGSKVPTLFQQPLADRPMAQVELARAEAALGAARALVFEVTAALWACALKGEPPASRLLALGRAAAIQAAETAAAVTRTASSLGGGGAIYQTSSLQRHMRDAEAITHHFTVAPHVWEEAGRVLLGRQPNVAVF